MRTMPERPSWERLYAAGRAVGVDRDAKMIRGYVVAQQGYFKSEGRGQFDAQSLSAIAGLMQKAEPAGLKSRFTHPDMSNDGLGKFLGRAHNGRVEGDRVRADLHLDESSFSTPSGNLGGYVMDLAESDPDAMSSSLVLQSDKVYELDANGRRKLDEQGNEIPPIWRPTRLHASDIVDTGDAVDGLLSAGIDVDGLPLGTLWRAGEMLDSVFAGQPRAVIEARCRAWLERYLSRRFGPDEAEQSLRHLWRRLRLAELGS